MPGRQIWLPGKLVILIGEEIRIAGRASGARAYGVHNGMADPAAMRDARRFSWTNAFEIVRRRPWTLI